MKAEVRRYTPRGSSDPITRMVIPARQLVLSPDMQEIRRGKVTTGTVLKTFEVNSEFAKRAERIVSDQEILANTLQRRHKKAWELLNV